MREQGMPAFPRSYNSAGHTGMELRDWFAGQVIASVMGGLATRSSLMKPEDISAACRAAYFAADIMMEERDK